MPRLSTSAPSTELTLTPGELRLVLAYRNMDDRRRDECAQIVAQSAAAHPRVPKRLLRLVPGGAK